MGCPARTQSGDPCRAPVRPGRGWCFWHDPEGAAERLKARRAGGKASHGLPMDAPPSSVRLDTLQDVVELLRVAAADCLGHKPSLSRARTLAHVASIAIKALEAGSLEERLTALEAHLREPAPQPREP